MDWSKVAKHLDDEGHHIRRNAEAAFPNDSKTQKEMRTRAAMLFSLAEALRAGLSDDDATATDRGGCFMGGVQLCRWLRGRRLAHGRG